MIINSFTEMDEDQAKSMIEKINPLLDIKPFVAKSSSVITQDLPFYPGHSFVQITDQKDKQKRRIVAVYKDQDIHILNWKNDTIYKLNEDVPVLLNLETILPYVLFFFTNVQGKEGKFFLVDTAEHIQWRDEPTKAAKRAISKMIEPMRVLSAENGEFVVQATIVFKQALFLSKMSISQAGIIEMFDQELLIEDLPVIEEI